ncbi:MAG: type II toxin-antitoxin system YafQ family toxin [Prevotellaceae bacterium]|jgi:mRNA interferase YafQ|nr:type II toxin-antitoxin system YafQ family toxin [Prevotellaceae bacterium]
MYESRKTGQFKKDVKLINRRNYDIDTLRNAMKLLEETGTLPVDKYKTHPLSGYSKKIITWDSHLEDDWILLWQSVESDLPEYEGVIIYIRTGTHSDLFR